MDNLLCDELIQEIFLRLSPSSSSSSASLVSKRWLCLYRSSRTSLSLRLSSAADGGELSSLLSQSPSLSSLRLLRRRSDPLPSAASNRLLLLAAASCPRLTHLRFSTGPASASSLRRLSAACPLLTSLHVSLPRPLRLDWLSSFKSLSDLSVTIVDRSEHEHEHEHDSDCDSGEAEDGGFEESAAELGLEAVALTGVGSGDLGVNWLWRSCKGLRKLKLRRCESIGDGGAFSSSVAPSLREVELGTCRAVADVVLAKLAANCDSLSSLTVHDGAGRDGLLRFIADSRSYNLQKLDLRLPLDLDNDHLLATAANLGGSLSALRLQSCCLVTGDGLRTLAAAAGANLVELALINCDVIEREPGLLATLGQSLNALRKLDLSFNDQLLDLEFVSMMASCGGLVELRLRGCTGLTDAALAALSKCCPNLETLDIINCTGFKSQAVELCVRDSRRLRRIQVEEGKISDDARIRASDKFIEMGN